MNIFTNPDNYVFLIPALPGLAFFVIVIGLLLHRKLFMRLGPYISILAIGAGAVISTFLFIKMVTGGYADTHNYLRPWAFEFQAIGNLKIHLGIALDGISVFTIFMVTVVACLIQIYSSGYMLGDANYGRYFAFHSLFVFSMIIMVLSDNLLSFFIGWELMGLCSYLLIGFFYQKHSAADAQKKAFLVTKLGDIGMFIGIMLLGALVLKAGLRYPIDENAPPNPMTGEKQEQIVKGYNTGNISFLFTDPGYEAIQNVDGEIHELESERAHGHPSDTEKAELTHEIDTLEAQREAMYLSYIESNEPIPEVFKNLDEALEFTSDFRLEVLKRYFHRNEFVDHYYPYMLLILIDPKWTGAENVGPRHKVWTEYCESLKTDPDYIAWVQNWPEFRDRNFPEFTTIDYNKRNWNGTLDNWHEFLDEMKTIQPVGFAPKARDQVKGILDQQIREQESRLAGTVSSPTVKIYNPWAKDLAKALSDRITDVDDKNEVFALIRELGFISALEANLISGKFQALAGLYITGDDETYPNAPVAGTFRKMADKLNGFEVGANLGAPILLNNYEQFRREVRWEEKKYIDRPVTIKELVLEYEWGLDKWLLGLAALLLFCGAVGKSAQVPLHVWLPDAMEGPTPVSALIHAATMVAAGVYLVGRFYFLFDAVPEVLTIVAYIGAITAFGAATVGLVLYDIKRVLAYSTISQLGYMMIGLGVGSLTAGLFHLIAHAYFKSLLFLGSGSVIHGSGTQDMREMGGLAKKMKWTYITFMAGTLALCGIFPFAGFWSKDEVLGAAFNWALHGNPVNFIVFLLGVGGAFLTAFYMFRLISMTFLGKYRGNQHVHESPPSMLIPLIILAVFATLYGLLGTPFVQKYNIFGKFVYYGAHHSANWLTYVLMIVSLSIAIAGVYAGLKLLNWGNPFKEKLKKRWPGFYQAVSSKYYFDEVYNGGIVVGFLMLCKLMRLIDTWIIDGIVNAAATVTERIAWLKGRVDLFIVDGAVNLLGWIVDSLSKLIRPLQSGYIQNAMLSVVVFIIVVLLAVVVSR
jgi:NADH:ubiquinone oxidoreductase subunit 5 (subunit L)/multisubunit Na+/H+ antiporter MnhA subunit